MSGKIVKLIHRLARNGRPNFFAPECQLNPKQPSLFPNGLALQLEARRAGISVVPPPKKIRQLRRSDIIHQSDQLYLTSAVCLPVQVSGQTAPTP